MGRGACVSPCPTVTGPGTRGVTGSQCADPAPQLPSPLHPLSGEALETVPVKGKCRSWSCCQWSMSPLDVFPRKRRGRQGRAGPWRGVPPGNRRSRAPSSRPRPGSLRFRPDPQAPTGSRGDGRDDRKHVGDAAANAPLCVRLGGCVFLCEHWTRCVEHKPGAQLRITSEMRRPARVFVSKPCALALRLQGGCCDARRP